VLVVADENMPYACEAFARFGEVQLCAGRAMTPEIVREADLLFVRSVTQVNPALLAGSRARFVGTATIGFDHVDVNYLKEVGIGFASAPGTNADSVAEYVIAALLVLSQRQGRRLAGRSLGIVGVGNVGSRVATKAQALGMKVLLNDPPLQRKTGEAKYLPLEALFDCDFITLHVPLERGGSDPTFHLADERFLANMRDDAVLLNTSRGAVADNAQLLSALDSGQIADAVLDVWEGEPAISTRLIERVALGTPHIAGYSFDGKVKGTLAVYAAACECLGLQPDWNPAEYLPPPEFPEITVRIGDRDPEDIFREGVLTIYPIDRDDAALRAEIQLDPDTRGAHFQRLRKEYPIRREFPNTTIKLTDGTPARKAVVAEALRGIGFKVSETDILRV